MSDKAPPINAAITALIAERKTDSLMGPMASLTGMPLIFAISTPHAAIWVRPDIMGRVISPFLAEYTFWYDARGTHPLIKYVGPMGKVNTGGVPTEIYETKSLTPHPGETKQN